MSNTILSTKTGLASVIVRFQDETGFTLKEYHQQVIAHESGRLSFDPALTLEAADGFKFSEAVLADARAVTVVAYGAGGPDCGPDIVWTGPVKGGDLPAGGGTCPGMGPEMLEAIQMEILQIEAGIGLA